MAWDFLAIGQMRDTKGPKICYNRYGSGSAGETEKQIESSRVRETESKYLAALH
jgi:hypothetical protein